MAFLRQHIEGDRMNNSYWLPENLWVLQTALKLTIPMRISVETAFFSWYTIRGSNDVGRGQNA